MKFPLIPHQLSTLSLPSRTQGAGRLVLLVLACGSVLNGKPSSAGAAGTPNPPPNIAQTSEITIKGDFRKQFNYASIGFDLEVNAGAIQYHVVYSTKFNGWPGNARRGNAMGFQGISITRNTIANGSNHWSRLDSSGYLILPVGERYLERVKIMGVSVEGFYAASGPVAEDKGYYFRQHTSAERDYDRSILVSRLNAAMNAKFPVYSGPSAYSESNFQFAKNIFDALVTSSEIKAAALSKQREEFDTFLGPKLDQAYVAQTALIPQMRKRYQTNAAFQATFRSVVNRDVHEFLRNDALLVDQQVSEGWLARNKTNLTVFAIEGTRFGNVSIRPLAGKPFVAQDTTRSMESPQMDWFLGFGGFEVTGSIRFPKSMVGIDYDKPRQKIRLSRGGEINLKLKHPLNAPIKLSLDPNQPTADDLELNRFVAFLLIAGYDLIPD